MPKVGLETDSSPCKHWELAETCGIRPDPTEVRPSPGPKVWTLSTPTILRFKGLALTAAPRIGGVRSFFAKPDFAQLEELLGFQNPRTPRRHKTGTRTSNLLVSFTDSHNRIHLLSVISCPTRKRPT